MTAGTLNVISVLVRLQGAQRVQAQMAQLTRILTSESRQIGGAGAAGMAALSARITALGTAMTAGSHFALKGYASFRQFEMGLQSLLGQQFGAKMARDLQKFALQSAYTTTEVQNMAQMMLAMGTPADKLLGRLGAMADLSASMGAGTAEFTRAAIQLAQIHSLGKVQYQDLKILSQSFPTQQIAKAAGKSSALELSGMSADDFFKAMERAANALGGVQEKLVRENPFIRFQNMLENLQAALIPVGRALNSLLRPFFMIGEFTIGLIQKFGELRAGATLLAAGGIYVLLKGFQLLVRDILVLRAGVLELARSAMQAAAAQRAAATQTLAGGVRQSPGGILLPPGVATKAVTGAATKGVGGAIAKGAARFGLGRIAGAIGARLGGAALANAVPVIGQVVSVGLLAWTAYDLVTALMNSGNAQPERRPATQPVQRSDIENMQWRMQAAY